MDGKHARADADRIYAMTYMPTTQYFFFFALLYFPCANLEETTEIKSRTRNKPIRKIKPREIHV